MVKYNKCPNCKRKGLYFSEGRDVCCFCGQSVPHKEYGEMKRKELLAVKKRIENQMSSHSIKRAYERSSRWRQVKSQLDDKNNKRHWLVELITIIGFGITFIISIVGLFKP